MRYIYLFNKLIYLYQVNILDIQKYQKKYNMTEESQKKAPYKISELITKLLIFHLFQIEN